MKRLLLLLARLCFRFRAYNIEVLKTPGPVLLIPNHVSWIDWVFLAAVLGDDWKFVTSSTTAKISWLHQLVMVNRYTFPVDNSSPYAVRDMADCLQKGGRLVLFAEGRISLSGSLMKIFDGTGFLIRKTNAKVITCYLRGANRTRLAKQKGWRRWFPKVSAHFSPVHTAPVFEKVAHTVARQKITQWLHDQMMLQQFEVEMAHGPTNILSAVLETAANIPGRVALEDATLKELTYRRLIVGTDILAGEWRRLLAPATGEPIGVLLPNMNTTVVVLLSLWAAGKVPAVLNFSTGIPVMVLCAQLAGLKQIITSRQFMEKARLNAALLEAAGLTLIYLEDVSPRISGLTKFTALLRHSVAIGAGLRGAPLPADGTAAILFTSGSEGAPKGVELTHRNLLANIRQASAVIDVTDDDRFFNALPLFHSFGLLGGALFPLIRGCYTFLYPSPLHYRIVPTLIYDRACTVLLSTNTFLNGYARRAHAYDFNSLRFLIAGAEKVQNPTLDLWARKFGVRILEGYGATECSPMISLNTRMDPCSGSAGRLVPGLEHRIDPVDGVTDGGRLFVKGPNVMKGYLNPEANATFQALGGWYDTGDIVHRDDEGFLHIRGRMKRFAKVSGEMVSLAAVEDALAGAFPQFGLRCTVAVVAVPDEDKGEKLIAVTSEPKLQLADVRAAIKAKGLSNLCAPKEIKLVPKIPKLGTGKTDYRGLEKLMAAPAAETGTAGPDQKAKPPP